MFSYRHAFHAGNHADVLKHSVLLHILHYLNKKETPYWIIDTHAGAGIYDLEDAWAEKTAEFKEGIARLWDNTDLPEDLQLYIDHIRNLNDDQDLVYYPGSPWISLELMRPKDRLHLFELHPTEIEVLSDNIEQQGREITRQVTIFEKDGFSGLKSQLPPVPRRGLILIDPSYEDKADYRHTLMAVKDGLKRFATGCYAVWYPLVNRKEVHDMIRQLEKLPGIQWLNASLTVKKPAADGYGLHGSGMFIINPPYTLHAALEKSLPYLAKHLAQDSSATFSLTRQGN
ncbi:23S rRNA (adenine(2030)-N(6))-methyltransferase RlmJ [Advenella alkanexedens]|uniref:Ribosomal RNA large subunit methyltransferase J n=1 Tax=Advenella alkanexedens TaxID=1481665 RepID=A0ABS6NPT7_9BURK|nr:MULTISPECIES: 23S rRNA (adenine(2030)-N(6))-methyltransferase RlmJ [Advenella]MBV4397384.1 23S rRNA (adenine(2030)-N(6))-methyltransferase RlmJ [Advenella alkanexedens]MDD3758899.1 23S rRNA (adenine(2030)-N(6))-methyltransferase RlmJ [Advenella sp.]